MSEILVNELFEKNYDKIIWNFLSGNPSEGAIRLLEANRDKIDWGSLCKNNGVFDFQQCNYVLK